MPGKSIRRYIACHSYPCNYNIETANGSDAYPDLEWFWPFC